MPEKCPRCDSIVDHPRQRAREKGFDPQLHCTMFANQLGLVIPCWPLKQFGCRAVVRHPTPELPGVAAQHG